MQMNLNFIARNNMRLILRILATAALVTMISGMSVMAQNERDTNLVKSEQKGWEYEVRAGLNFGGASPFPLPREIRKIKSFNPKFNGTIEGVATKWIYNGKWGISGGLKLEEKGMETGAQVKNYHTKVVNGDQKVEGYFTGYNRTKYNSLFLTVPIMANYRFNSRWKVRAGVGLSVLLDGDFSGYVKDGYLRSGTPTGEKVTFSGDGRGTFDFSDDLSKFQCSAIVGGSWRAYRHFSVTADLSWGLLDIFKSSFKTISFNLYPVYLDIGFSYTF
jgi:hypothetical protein